MSIAPIRFARIHEDKGTIKSIQHTDDYVYVTLDSSNLDNLAKSIFENGLCYSVIEDDVSDMVVYIASVSDMIDYIAR